MKGFKLGKLLRGWRIPSILLKKEKWNQKV